MPILEQEQMLLFFITITIIVIVTLIVLNMPGQFQGWIKPEAVCTLYADRYAYYFSDIKAAVLKHNLDIPNAEALVAGLITVESSWNENARRYEPKIRDSSYGLMQIVPSYHPECDKEKLIADPIYNIDCGVGILSKYIADCNGDVEGGLRKYNTGSCTGQTYDPQYVQKILTYKAAFETCPPLA